MAYYDIYLLTQDADFSARAAASYAVETLGDPKAVNPHSWAIEHIWDLAAQPGFAAAYAYALATGVQNPGKDPSVITDAQILAAVQMVASSGA